MSIFRNPVSYCFYAIFGLLVLASFVEAPAIVLQHLIIPYTVDITRGVGETGAALFRAVTFVVQVLIVLCAVLVARTNSRRQRFFLAVLGVLFVGIYFLVVVLGYAFPRIH